MRPTLLKPGMTVVVDDGHAADFMVFVRRDRQPCRPALNWFQCDAYRGINGAGDRGLCTMSDYRVSRFVTHQPLPSPILERGISTHQTSPA